MSQELVARVVARYKTGDEHNPDPLSYKAFLSEFKQGFETGREKNRSGPVPVMNELVAVEEKIATASKDLLDLARRIDTHASAGRLAVNEHRLAAKVSGILSTLFYQTGLARGIKQGGVPAGF